MILSTPIKDSIKYGFSKKANEHIQKGGKINIHPRINAVDSESEEAPQKCYLQNCNRVGTKSTFKIIREHGVSFREEYQECHCQHEAEV